MLASDGSLEMQRSVTSNIGSLSRTNVAIVTLDINALGRDSERIQVVFLTVYINIYFKL